MRDISGALAVVTGAGSGIGRATALALAEAGARVVAADVDLDGAKRTAELAGLIGPVGHAAKVDVSDAKAMEKFAAAVQTEHGAPRIVVNNAGIGMAGSVLETGRDDWQRIIGVNLWGSSTAAGCSARRWWGPRRRATSSTWRPPRRSPRTGRWRRTPPRRPPC